jgi:hypothetical protein
MEGKQHFPHLFNRTENLDLHLPTLPPLNFYNYDNLKPAAQKELLLWHSQSKDDFLLRRDLALYCIHDTDLLTAVFLKASELFINVTGESPFITNTPTLASFSMRTMKRLVIKDEQIAILPESGYSRNIKTSHLARKYLKYLAYKNRVYIRTWDSPGGEKCYTTCNKENRKEKLFCDGFVEGTPDVIIEILGCYSHGHECQGDPSRPSMNPDLTLESANQRTFHRLRQLALISKANVKYIWECTILREAREDPEFKLWWSRNDVVRPIQIREALYGGRVEHVRVHCKADDQQEILMTDVTSIYPHIMHSYPHALKTPIIWIKTINPSIEYEKGQLIRQLPENMGLPWTIDDDLTYRGILLVKILPPKKLLFPVIPLRVKGKCVFALCNACSIRAMNTKISDQAKRRPCTHNDERRSWIGTYCDAELKACLMRGYVILDVYEIWEYKEFSSELFKPYIDIWLKQKMQASGFPSGVETEEDKLNYIAEYKEHQGITLEYDKIAKNNGARANSKLALNSKSSI